MEQKELTGVPGRRKGEMVCMLVNAPWLYHNHMGIVLLRVGVSCMMLMHGTPKLVMMLQGQGDSWLDPLGIGSTLSLALCVFAEFFCSLAILVGIFTRLAALVLAFNFWVITFVFDNGQSWEVAELPLLYLVCYATLICTGAGRWSLDRLMWKHFGCHVDEAPAPYHGEVEKTPITKLKES